MLCGCRWYFDEQIKIELATKNGSFVHIKDPISFPEFEQVNFINNLGGFWLFTYLRTELSPQILATMSCL